MSRIPMNPVKLLHICDFEDQYWTVIKQLKQSARRALYATPKEVGDAFDDDDSTGDDAAADLPGNEDIGDDEAADIDDVFLIPDAVFGSAGSQAASVAVNELCDDMENIEVVTTYEELVRRHVEGFMASAKRYMQDTEVARHVAEWQENIQPRLDEEEQRRVFDIHTYGSELLSKLEALGGVDSPVLFHHAVARHQPYDICRYFLASLQLANDGNVEIGRPTDRDITQAVDTATMKVLSRHQRFENLDSYQAPSLRQNEAV